MKMAQGAECSTRPVPAFGLFEGRQITNMKYTQHIFAEFNKQNQHCGQSGENSAGFSTRGPMF